jgi:hypothetical protein
MTRIRLVMCTIAALTAIPAGAGEQLRLAVSPAQSFAPSTLNIRARMIPNAENRMLTVVAESGGFYRSSEIALDGDRAPATMMFEFRAVPGGEYVVYGILTDSGGRRRAIATQPVRVIDLAGR